MRWSTLPNRWPSASDRSQETDDAERLVHDAVAEDCVKRSAIDHLGHEVGAVAVIGELVEARDGGVLQRDIGTQLEKKPAREADVLGDARADGPHCHPSVKARVLGFVDHAEAVGLDLA